jgi:hypothetical protein
MLATKWNSWYTVSRMKQCARQTKGDTGFRKGETAVSDVIWETFDSLFKTVNRQGRRVEELEARVVELERRLQERAAQTPHTVDAERVTKMPSEKAA